MAAKAVDSISTHAVLVNPIQQRNPVTKLIRSVPWELGDIIPDFVMGRTTCCLFVSIQYHSLHPNYIHERIKHLGKLYQLRILLVLVDTQECHKILKDLAHIAILSDLTLIVCWSNEEAARYIETYKIFENKPPDILMERGDLISPVSDCLTTVKKINKTDAATLTNIYESLDKIITSSKDELTMVPGLGEQKAERLYTLFNEPFMKSKPT